MRRAVALMFLLSGCSAPSGGVDAVGSAAGASDTYDANGGASSGGAGSGSGQGGVHPNAGATSSGGYGGKSGQDGGQANGGNAGGAAGGSRGGTGGTGGSAGMKPTGGAPGNCASLPVSGTWENIEPAGVTQSNALIVDPFDAAIVWLGTKGSGLYESKDCGSTWAHVSTGRNAGKMASGQMVSMAIDPVTRGVIYTTSWTGAEGVWKSTNSGVDWDEIYPTPELINVVGQNSEMSSVAMEDANPLHLIVSAHSPCTKPHSAICVAETSDGGATWHIVDVPGPSQTPSGNWTNYMPGAGAFILGAKTWLFPSYSDGLWLTTDDGQTWKNVTPQGASGATGGKTLNHPFVPSPEGTYYLVSQQGMLSSKDGLAWTLIPNSGGSGVGFAMGGGRLYSADQWTVSYHSAPDRQDKTWSQMTAPPAPIFETFPQGGVYLAYDEPHHILYSSNWYGGTWRTVTP